MRVWPSLLPDQSEVFSVDISVSCRKIKDWSVILLGEFISKIWTAISIDSFQRNQPQNWLMGCHVSGAYGIHHISFLKYSNLKVICNLPLNDESAEMSDAGTKLRELGGTVNYFHAIEIV